jgi:hypothetical protein
MPNKGDESWDLPLQPQPAATKRDYYVLLAVVVLVLITAASCCGIGFYAGKVVFG